MTFPSSRTPHWIRALVYRGWLRDARAKARAMVPFLAPGARILDVGSGPGSVCQLLRGRGHPVIPIDVRDVGYRIRPVIYDGRRMPFRADAFDVALVLTVLHHTREPEAVLREAARVARRLLVIEDIHGNAAQGALTRFTDSVVNLEFRGHPHRNRTDPEWRRTFGRVGLTLRGTTSWQVAGVFQQALYVLDR